MRWRTRPLPADWPDIRAAILTRDNHTCQQCGDPATDVDHIKPEAYGGTHHPTNLQALCHTCHATKTAHDANLWRQPRNRPPEPHPGTRQP